MADVLYGRRNPSNALMRVLAERLGFDRKIWLDAYAGPGRAADIRVTPQYRPGPGRGHTERRRVLDSVPLEDYPSDLPTPIPGGTACTNTSPTYDHLSETPSPPPEQETGRPLRSRSGRRR
jgi:hypothetical protein